MSLLSSIYHWIVWPCQDSTEQNVLVKKAERFSCIYYCLFMFLARLRFFGYTTSRQFPSTLLCYMFSYLAPLPELTMTAHDAHPTTTRPSFHHISTTKAVFAPKFTITKTQTSHLVTAHHSFLLQANNPVSTSHHNTYHSQPQNA